jgi:hypothetical protein
MINRFIFRPLENFATKIGLVKETNNDNEQKILEFNQLMFTSANVEMLKEFLMNDNTVTGICFYRTQMTIDLWKDIASCLINHKTSKSLTFSWLNFSVEGFYHFCEVLSQKDTLELIVTKLLVRRNQVVTFEESDAQCILSAISRNKALRKIKLKAHRGIIVADFNLSSIFSPLISLPHIREVNVRTDLTDISYAFSALENNNTLDVIEVKITSPMLLLRLCKLLSRNYHLQKFSAVLLPSRYKLDDFILYGIFSNFEENGSIIGAHASDERVRHHFCKIAQRNKSMHMKACQAVCTILAIQKKFRSQFVFPDFVFPKDLARMIGAYLLKTKTDIQSWAILSGVNYHWSNKKFY